MSLQRIRTGDTVIIRAGRDKGKTGTVESIDHLKQRARVAGVNVQKKHMRRTQNNEGGIIEKEGPVHLSNIALYNPVTQKADKTGVKMLEDGKKVRYFKSNNELVEQV